MKLIVLEADIYVDSAQIIDFIDLKCDTTIDLGSGGGMPGIIIAIIMKNLKKNTRVLLYEKSHHKSIFLKEVSEKLKLKTGNNPKKYI